MKKVIIVFTIGILVASIFQSCKKGENDPAFSLRSRKARLVGEWVLTSGQQDIVVDDGTTKTYTTYTYDGANRVESGSAPGTIVYSETVTINKDMTFQSVEHRDTDVLTIDGYWFFGRKSKELDLKNKETVRFTYKSISNSSGDIYGFTGNELMNNGKIWQLDQLKNKEIVVLFDGSITSSSGTTTYKGTMTYQKK